MPTALDATTFYRENGFYLHTEPLLEPDAIAATIRGTDRPWRPLILWTS